MPTHSTPPVPAYLERVYWWAYVRPRAVRVFDRGWLVNAILFGNYARLRAAAVNALAPPGMALTGRSLQVACVYGNLTQTLLQRLAPDATLDVIDILCVQLANLRAKLAPDARIALRQCNAAALPDADARYDRVLLFFLLHEQPEAVRRATLAEALRVVRPGGKVVILDYHRPHRWHPLRGLMRLVFLALEPFAIDLWRNDLVQYLPEEARACALEKTTWFGGLYQRLVITRAGAPCASEGPAPAHQAAPETISAAG